MYSAKDLHTEVREFIGNLVESGAMELEPNWITIAIIQKHKPPEGTDKGFWLCCSRQAVRAEVRQQFSKFKAFNGGEVGLQTTLPGFAHVQKFYAIGRKGKQILAHIDSMTTQEIKGKCLELINMGNGCYQHAEELEKYLNERKSQAPGVA